MRKRILSLLLCCVMLLGLMSTAVFAADGGSTDTGKAIQIGTSQIKGGQAGSVYFGTYKQTSDGSGGYNTDPIKWRVLSNADGKLFLLSNQNLDVKLYNSSDTSITWEKSTIRSWLNGYGANENSYGTDYSSDSFIGTAFSDGEQSAIADTYVYNATQSDGSSRPNPSYSTSGGNNTTDKIFLLSIEEANNSSCFPNEDDSRKSTNTAYVASYSDMKAVGEVDYWWLRSPGNKANFAADVLIYGNVDILGGYVNNPTYAVRPAFNLNLNSVLFTSAAVGGKADTTVDENLTAVTDYTGSEWKLTLKDSSRSFSANVNGQTCASAPAGGSVQITYSGAQTGGNEYVSVLLCDSNDNVLYYGNIAQSSASGTASVTIPAGLAASDYTLKVFSEQCNGDKKTDYASGFVNINLNITPDEQFSLTPGGIYYFDLSGENIPGTPSYRSRYPSYQSLHYVPFVYIGTVDAYKLTERMFTTEAYAEQNKYAHSLFVVDYGVTVRVTWNQLNDANLIFGRNYENGGVSYTLRAPSVGSKRNTGMQGGTPKSNEWDVIMDKNPDYAESREHLSINSWGQDDSMWGSERMRVARGYRSVRDWMERGPDSNSEIVFCAVLEVLNPDALGFDGLKAVTLDLNGGKMGSFSDNIQIIVKNGSVFTAPASDGLTRPDGDTGNFFMWLGSNGKLYAPGDSVPADVTELTVQWTAPAYTVTLNANGGTIGSGNVTGYTYGIGVTLPTADDMTYTGYTFRGWYDNEALTGTPITAISNTEAGNKEYWAKWEINQYTVTVRPENGKADITIMQDYGTPITAPTLTREGYQFNGWDKAFPTTMPAGDLTVTAQWLDIAAPTGEISIAENGWKAFLNNITFGLFFKDTQTVTVTAADNSGEAVKIEYLLSEKELTQAELAGMTFTAYSAPFNIDSGNEYVIYAKLTDTSDNVSYINTDGIVLDSTVPVISGIEAGKTYCAAQTVTVTEKYIDTVKVNGTEVSLDENGQFVLSPASSEQTIVVTDKAGNEITIAVTVNDSHTGGNANCKDKVICEVCGESYGEIDVSNHADMKHIEAKAATKTAEGNIEYWYCEDCSKYFADKDGLKEITKADTVTAKLPEEKPASPATGDTSNLTLWIALLFISGSVITGITVTGRKKKRLTK